MASSQCQDDDGDWQHCRHRGSHWGSPEPGPDLHPDSLVTHCLTLTLPTCECPAPCVWCAAVSSSCSSSTRGTGARQRSLWRVPPPQWWSVSTRPGAPRGWRTPCRTLTASRGVSNRKRKWHFVFRDEDYRVLYHVGRQLRPALPPIKTRQTLPCRDNFYYKRGLDTSVLREIDLGHNSR